MPPSPEDPFAPPEAAIGRSGDPFEIPTTADDPGPAGENVTRLLLRWEGVRLAFNLGLGATFGAVLWIGRGPDPLLATVPLILIAVVINLAFCVGPILPRPEWRDLRAAGLLGLLGLSLVAVVASGAFLGR